MSASRLPAFITRRTLRGAGLACLLLMAAAAAWRWQTGPALGPALVSTPPDAVVARPDLVRFAARLAAPVYAARCAACHGADKHGSVAAGTPDLADQHWLYGTGRVSDIERTILFGIRAGNGKSRNVAAMPAYGQTGQLQPPEIRTVVSYVISLTRKGQNADAVAQGRALYVGQGGCAECHGRDARGNAEYGAPDLTAGAWSYGGSAQALYQTIDAGRHGVCPAWYGVLSLDEIRALAVMLAVQSGGAAS